MTYPHRLWLESQFSLINSAIWRLIFVLRTNHRFIWTFFGRQYSKFLLVAIMLALAPGPRAGAQSLGNFGGDKGSGAAFAGRAEAWRYSLRFGIAVEGMGILYRNDI
jgi:hypothetical protein